MRSKILVVLIAVAVMGVSSTAMAKAAGGGGGSMGHGHGHMGHHHHFRNNPFLFGGWDWGLGGYGDSGYGSTTVVVSPPPVPRFPAAGVTGSVATTPCHF